MTTKRVPKWLRANAKFIAFVLLLGVFRTAVADWNPIPSASMHPNLLEGDVVFVNRLAFDVKVPLTDVVIAHTGDPERGDIVTFTSPENGMRLIKRVIGLPGDTIEMRNKRLYVNGAVASYDDLGLADEPLAPHGVKALHVEEGIGNSRHEIQWLVRRGQRDDFGPLTIAPDRYLMLGDNRDNSEDSRWFGVVPREKLIGRAERILVSADYKDTWAPRFDRFGKSLRQ
ncbi:MAG TPA: signal peptidase I [Rhodanobacteraceae bacterium]|nr:signal peptidase I [Rhodanobacteraceae bacterium]